MFTLGGRCDIGGAMIPQVSVIVPTYNEKESIFPLVERIHAALQDVAYEIVFVDDNSPDGTGQVIQQLAARFPIRYISREKKDGLASAILQGFAAARGSHIGAINADLQHPPEVLKGLLDNLCNGSDIAVASRYIPGGGIRDWSLWRRLVSWGATAFSRLLLPIIRPVHDPLSGYYMMQKKVILLPDHKVPGFKVLLEVLMQGRYEKVSEVPYVFVSRQHGKSKLGFRQTVEFLWQVAGWIKKSGELVRFLKFLTVGATGILINMGILYALTEWAGWYYLISSVIAIETAILNNYFLNDRFTFSNLPSAPSGKKLFRLLKYNLVSLGGMTLNVGLLWFFTSVFGVYYLIANLIGIVSVTVLRYLVHLNWTWK